MNDEVVDVHDARLSRATKKRKMKKGESNASNYISSWNGEKT
jgi:hypothetical protein